MQPWCPLFHNKYGAATVALEGIRNFILSLTFRDPPRWGSKVHAVDHNCIASLILWDEDRKYTVDKNYAGILWEKQTMDENYACIVWENQTMELLGCATLALYSCTNRRISVAHWCKQLDSLSTKKTTSQIILFWVLQRVSWEPNW